VSKVGWAKGVCLKCGRLWQREQPADSALCDCHRHCPNCGKEMQPYTPDLDPHIYRNEDLDDPTGAASRHEATARTRLYCPDCGCFSDGMPVEVKLK